MKSTCTGMYHSPVTNYAKNENSNFAQWWFKLLLLFIVFISGLHEKVIRAQGALKYTITYVAETRYQYNITDSVEAFSIPEQVNLMPHFERDSIIKQVYTNNDIKTTMFHQVNTRFPSYFKRPGKTIIDKSRVKMFDTAGVLMLNKPHSNAYKSLNSQLKSYLTTNSDDIIPTFVYLSPSMKTSLTANGFTMTNLGDGHFRFVKDSITLYYNNSLRINEIILYHTDGSLKYARKRTFKTNSYGVIVPGLEIVTVKDKRFDTDCVNEVRITDYVYYHYTMAGPGGKYEDEDMSDDEPLTIEVIPNPAVSDIIVNVPVSDKTQPIRVFDNVGRLVYETLVEANAYEVRINIKAFETGVYYVQLQHTEGLITQSFIKN